MAGDLGQRDGRGDRELGPLLLVSGLVLAYGAVDRAYEWSHGGSILRGLSSVGVAILALFNIAVALRLIRRAA